jgi:hypothetical protein
MANFNTHLNVATIATGLASAILLSASHIDLNTALWLWFLGSVGGLLPDIDSDSSTSLDSLFNLFSLIVVLMVLRYITGDQFAQIKLTELIVIPLLVYAIMKYIIRVLFEKITVHRGSCHSLIFILLSALLTTKVTWLLSSDYTAQSDIIAWLSGGFIFLGGLIHLLLDEIYSVDLRNTRIKSSFGTAMKLADFKNSSATLIMFIAIIALSFIAPATENTINILTNWSKLTL